MSFQNSKYGMWLIVLLFFAFPTKFKGQFSLSEPFENCSELYINFGVGISTYDFDRDGWDDITICDAPCGVRAFRNLGNGQFELYYTFLSLNTAKCPTWVDYDNDGDSDFFFTCDNSMIQLYRNEGNGNFTNVTTSLVETQASARSMGASWGDYDRDGWLDLYVCNYNYLYHENWLFHNNGDGTFDEVGEEMGVSNGLRVSFQSTWCDLNQDGWQDLYVVNDLSNVNTFYINQQGVFVDASTEYGLDVALNSMSNSISDYDNDGDFDIYISNTSLGNYLMRNDDGYFINVANDTPLDVNEWAWSGLWIDYDNDSDDDLHISTRGLPNFPAQNPFYVNEEGSLNHINLYGLQNDFFESTCAAKGDFNNDGLWDFAVANQAPTSTRLWTNIEQEPGNWIKIGLEGIISNRDGVGSIIRCYHGGAMNLLQTYCGENYMSQDSQYEIIGLGGDSLVDSLSITWPSGWVDWYTNLQADTTYTFTEGESFQAHITSDTGFYLCGPLGSTILEVNEGSTFLWSDGSTDQTLEVNEADVYTVQVTNEFGFQSTDSIAVLEVVDPLVDVIIQHPVCHGDSTGAIILGISDSTTTVAQWQDLEQSFGRTELPAGSYSVELIANSGCVFEHFFELQDPEVLSVDWEYEAISCHGGTTAVTTYTNGGTGSTEVVWNEVNPETVSAGEYIVEVQDMMGCQLSDTLQISEPSELLISNLYYTVCAGDSVCAVPEISGGISPYEVDWNGANACALQAGSYPILILDSAGCELNAEVLVESWQQITISAQITAADNGANGMIELFISGGLEPFAWQWSDGSVDNPAVDLSQGNYQCLVTDAAGCSVMSDWYVLMDTGIEFISAQEPWIALPNPFDDSTILRGLSEYFGLELNIYNSTGRLVHQSVVQADSFQIQTSDWSSGLYLATCGNKYVFLMRQ